MVKGSYKPREGQLLHPPHLKEFFLTNFKGVKAKPLRMSGELFDAVNTFMVAIHDGKTIDEEIHREVLLNMVGCFRKLIHGRDSNIKRRRYETGFSTKTFQILLTHSTYPAPHMPDIGISLVTLDIGFPGSVNQVIRFVSWEAMYSDKVDIETRHFYNNRIKRSIAVEHELNEGLVDMIFELVVPPENLKTRNVLNELMKVA